MAYDTSPTETRTATTVAPRYRRYLAGYLALSVVGTDVLLVLAKHSSNLLAAVELVVGSLLVVASVATIPAFYKDANGLDSTAWNRDWTPVGWSGSKTLLGVAVGGSCGGGSGVASPSVAVGKNGTIVERVSDAE